MKDLPSILKTLYPEDDWTLESQTSYEDFAKHRDIVKQAAETNNIKEHDRILVHHVVELHEGLVYKEKEPGVFPPLHGMPGHSHRGHARALEAPPSQKRYIQ